ncbi:MAG: hypothetical protein U0793_04970 [Gemmataceae bacterium]
MSKHSKMRPAPSPDNLQQRVQRAFVEGRYQTALDLAKQLNKEQPSAEHKELLLDAVQHRADQLLHQGNAAGAALVKAYMPQVEASSARLGRFLSLLAVGGEIEAALAWRERVGDEERQRLERRLADALILLPQRRPQAPAAWQADAVRVDAAFHALAEGADDKAPEILQGIGLQSPFLEWRVLLRGLLAYYQGQDDRARDNWARLSAGGLPAQLVAPLRCAIDPDFRHGLDGDTQARLLAISQQLTADPVEGRLRQLRAMLHEEEVDFGRCLQIAQDLARDTSDPELSPVLWRRVYWALAQRGDPDDVARFGKRLPAPPDDPGLNRLNALVSEAHMLAPESHAYWAAYEVDLANNAVAWPAEQLPQARALVWLRMGHNAARFNPETVPPSLKSLRPVLPKPLKPEAITCYRRAIALAPDLDEAHVALYEALRLASKLPEAEEALLGHLAQRPNYPDALRALADVRGERRDFPGVLEALQRAVAQDPLDQTLRHRMRQARWSCAAHYAGTGRTDEARALFKAVLDEPERPRTGFVLALWGVAELKWGQTAEGERLLAEAYAEAPQRLAPAWLILSEAKRLKLPRPLLKRFQTELDRELSAPPRAAAGLACLIALSAYDKAGLEAPGAAAIEKKIVKYLESVRPTDFTVEQMDMWCLFLLERGGVRAKQKALRQARQRFPTHALYPFFEARERLRERGGRADWIVQDLLRRAEQLAEKEKDQTVLEEIRSLQRDVQQLNPLLSMLENMMGVPLDGPFEPKDDEDSW